VVLRDREQVDFKPRQDDFVNSSKGLKALPKENIGVLESTGTLILDDARLFEEMKRWTAEDISKQIRKIIASVSPKDAKVADFEAAVRELFP
jgi:hypothetical protein